MTRIQDEKWKLRNEATQSIHKMLATLKGKTHEFNTTWSLDNGFVATGICEEGLICDGFYDGSPETIEFSDLTTDDLLFAHETLQGELDYEDETTSI
jgi:hypothetical protein